MASILRRGRIPAPPTGITEFIDEIYTIKGFFGPWAHLFRKHNTAHVISASRPDLIYQGLDTNGLEPTDARDPSGEPLVLLDGPKNAVAVSARSRSATSTAIRSGSTTRADTSSRPSSARSTSALAISS
jgi:hypothetical protein